MPHNGQRAVVPATVHDVHLEVEYGAMKMVNT